ncbi:anthrone oxygenase family protein [Actinoplanes sp. G11-F43]|uniref:anthrone oxygenase family protein n=1 Tax=Actinoplanes sp. G11-F43 TaxID=3424130 RepID=UPI003D347080
MDRLLIPITLLANGIAVGVMVSTVIGLAPMSLAVSYERYVATIQYLWKRYDPFMPIMNALACVLDLALAVVADGDLARVLFGSAGVLLLIVMAISVFKNVPINRYVMSLDPQVRPADWEHADPRLSWRNWNLVRTALAVLAFATNLVAVTVLL